tara:strand:- start:24118 stop:24390 length:273 start_codon:yes stop_codon:yes gene_type:complete
MKIKRKKYNKALDIVEQYHKQVAFKIAEITEAEKTTWDTLINSYSCGSRLRNIIVAHPDFYIEDMNRHMFMSFNNAGAKSWTEFVDLRGY